MKILKRVIACFLILIISLAVGYLCFTGSRLKEMNAKENAEGGEAVEITESA